MSVGRRLEGSTNLPGNWLQFLRIDANQAELFNFLAVHLTHLETEKQVVTTNGEDALCRHPQYVRSFAPCNHEEADSRMILHLEDDVNVGYKKVILQTVDTGVVVLAVALTVGMEIQELWVAFGTGQHFR